MKTIVLYFVVFLALTSCQSKKTQPPIEVSVEVPEFDSSSVRPLHDSVNSLYRIIQ